MNKSNRKQAIAFFLAIVLLLTSCLEWNVPKRTLKAQDISCTSFLGENFEATFLLDSTYEGGYQARIQLKNTGKQTIHNWTLRMSFSSEIKDVWNASIEKHDAGVYYLKNAFWNQDIKPNEIVEFGFTGCGANPVIAPASYEIMESKNIVNDLQYQVCSRLIDIWEDGYQGELVLTNNRENTIEDWCLEFDYIGEITQVFQGEIKSHVGNHYVIENAGYNADIDTNQALVLGYLGTGKQAESPVNYVLWERTYCEKGANNEPKPTIQPTATDTEPEPTAQPTGTVLPSATLLPTVTDDGTIIEGGAGVPSLTSLPPDMGDEVMESKQPSVDRIPDEYKESVLYPILMIQGRWEDESSIQENEDYDNDGLTNLVEYQIGTDPGLADTDGDGLTDYQEYKNYGTNPIEYDSDQDGLGDGTEWRNHFNPLKADTDGDGILDGEEKIIDQQLTNEVYKNLDRNNLNVWPSISVTGKGDYSKQIRLENESYNGLYSTLDYLVSPVIHVEHRDDMKYDGAKVSFQIGDEILRNHRLSDLSIVRLEDGVTIPIKTLRNSSSKVISADVDKLCEYAVEDTRVRTTIQERQNPLEDLEIIYVVGLAGDTDVYGDFVSFFMTEWDGYFANSSFVYDYDIKSKIITYSEQKDDIQSYEWMDDPCHNMGNFYRDFVPKFAISSGKNPENKIEALDLACSSFTEETSHKLLVLVCDEGLHEFHGQDYAVELYKEKLAKNSDISFLDVKEYRTQDGIYSRYYEDMELSLNEPVFGEKEYLRLNRKICKGIWGHGEPDLNFPNMMDEYLHMMLNEKEEMQEQENTKTLLVRLSDYQLVRVSVDPTKDTDGDGIPDQSELADRIGYCLDKAGDSIPVYQYRSNPLKADTDGDGIADGKDPRPLSYDVTVAGYGDNGVVRLNTGKALQILFSKEYPVDQFIKEYYNRHFSLDKPELEGIYYALQSAKRINYTTDELVCINLLDEGLMKWLVQDKSLLYKCQLYEHLFGKVLADVETGNSPPWNSGEVKGFVFAKDVENYYRLPVKQEAWLQCFDSTVKQMLFGRFSELEGTSLGAIGEVGMAFTGLDVAQDIRDLLYDTTHWENSWEHVGDTVLSAIGLVPLIGAVAKSDEIIVFIKHTEKLCEIRRVARMGDSVMDAIKRVTKAAENLMLSAEAMVKRFGDSAYRAMLYAQDSLRAQGRGQLRLAYANEFTEAFAKYSDDIDSLSSKPSLLQRAFKNAMEDCTDSAGVVKSTREEIERVAKRHIDDALKDAPTALSGEWKKVNEGIRGYSREYQAFITGHDGEVWMQNGVKFDGMKDGALIEVKGRYDQFIEEETGEFIGWFSGMDGMIAQARRQVEASEGAPIHWYFAQEKSMNLIKEIIEDKFPQIKCIYKPMIEK